MDERLIDEVAKHPPLYDTTCAGYRDNATKDNLWFTISANLGLSIEETRQRWKNLRDTFVRNRRKRKANEARGLKDLKDWRYNKLMSFLTPFIQDRSSTTGHSPFDGITDEDGEYSRCSETEEDVMLPAPEKISPPVSPVRRPLNSSVVVHHPPEKKQNIVVAENKRVVLPNIVCKANTNGKQLSLDEDELFALSLVPTFRRLTSRQRAWARLKIRQILFDIEFTENNS